MIEITYPCGYIIRIKNSFCDYLSGNALDQQIPQKFLYCPLHGKKCRNREVEKNGCGEDLNMNYPEGKVRCGKHCYGCGMIHYCPACQKVLNKYKEIGIK